MPISPAKFQNALKCSTSMSEATSNVNTVSERVAIVTFIVVLASTSLSVAVQELAQVVRCVLHDVAHTA